MVGDWLFSPSTASLSRGGEKRRLEHRAATVLEFLCKRQGEPVTADELIEAVWDGRALSRNSVAVVIGDLRRALDDDSRHPRYIETVAKRGYRMAVPVEQAPVADLGAEAGAAPTRSRWLAVAAAVLVVLVMAGLYFNQGRQSLYTISVADVRNETYNPKNDALALAVTEVLRGEAASAANVRVVRAAGNRVDAQFKSSLILWNGQVSLSVSAQEPATGTVLWSGIGVGPADQLPRQTRELMQAFGEYVADPKRPR